MRNRSGRLSLSMVCALALVIGLSAAASASAATLTERPSKKSITYNRETLKITGTLQTDPGVSPANRQVKLLERAYPYKRVKVVARTATDATGRYAFGQVQPDVNSRYRAVVSDPAVSARSANKLVVVFARGNLNVRTTRDGHAKSHFLLVYSPKLRTRLAGRRILWYFHRLGNPRFTVRDRTRTRQPRPGRLKGRSRFALPNGDYRYEVTYCIDTPDKRDIGIGPPGVSRDCPRKFRARSRGLARASAGVAAVSGGLSASAVLAAASR